MPRYFNSPLRTNRQIFVSSSTFNVPPGVSLVYVTLVGGGGGGSGGGLTLGGSGGGAGFSFVNTPVYVNPTESIYVQVASGGLGGAPTPAAGQRGANSIFGNYLVASGGEGGTTFAGTRAGAGAGYAFIAGGLGGLNRNLGLPPTSGGDGMYVLTQSISSAGTLFTMAAGGGGGGGNQEGVEPGAPGGFSGDKTLSPFLPASGSNDGGGGGASALGAGGNAVRTPGLGGGGGGGRVNGGNPTSGTRGGPGFCSVSWD
jgi:hypothetical protein